MINNPDLLRSIADRLEQAAAIMEKYNEMSHFTEDEYRTMASDLRRIASEYDDEIANALVRGMEQGMEI